VIEVDKPYSFLGHMHSPWSTSKHSLIRLRVLHFWNFLRLRFKEIWDISLKIIVRQISSYKFSVMISHCGISLTRVLHWERLILDIGLCRVSLDHMHCNSRVLLISNTLILNRLGIRWKTRSSCIDLWRRCNPYYWIINLQRSRLVFWNTGGVRFGWNYAGPRYPSSTPFLSVSIR
jgi:hypothetical protein